MIASHAGQRDLDARLIKNLGVDFGDIAGEDEQSGSEINESDRPSKGGVRKEWKDI